MAVKTGDEFRIPISIDDKASKQLLGMQKIADQAKNAFKTLGSAVVVANQAFELFGKIQRGIDSAFTGTVGRAIELQKNIAEITTLLDDSTGAQQQFTKEILSLQRQFGASQTDLAKSYYQAISSGAVDATSAMDLMVVANKLAVGGVTTLETAVDGLTSLLNAYGMSANEAARVSDIMFIGMKAGKTTIAELSSQLGQAAPLAATLGVGMDELVSSVSAITTGGVKTSIAVTQMRAAMVSLMKPTETMQIILNKLGITSIKAAISQDGLVKTVNKIIGATDGSAESIGKLFGSIEATNAVMAVTSGQIGQKFNSTMENMEKAAEKVGQTTEKSFSEIAAEADFKLKLLDATVTARMTSIGNALTGVFVQMKTSSFTALDAVLAKVEKFITVIQSIDFKPLTEDAEAFQLALIGVGAAMSIAFSAQILAAMKVVAITMKAMAVAATPFALLAAKIIGIAVAFIAVVAAIEVLIRNFDVVILGFKIIGQTGMAIINRIGRGFVGLAGHVLTWVESILEGLAVVGLGSDDALASVRNGMVSVGNALDSMNDSVDGADSKLGLMSDTLSEAMGKLDTGISGKAFGAVKDIVTGLNTELDDTVDKLGLVSEKLEAQKITAPDAPAAGMPAAGMPAAGLPAAVGDAKKPVEMPALFKPEQIDMIGAQMGAAFGENVGAASATMAGGMSAALSGIMGGIAAAGMVVDALKGVVSAIPDLINSIAELFNMITEFPLMLADAIVNLVMSMADMIANLIPNLIEGVGRIVDVFFDLPEILMGALMSLTEKLPQIMGRVGESLAKFLLMPVRWISLLIKLVPILIKSLVNQIGPMAEAFVDAFVDIFKMVVNDLASAIGLDKPFSIDTEALTEDLQDMGDQIAKSASQLFSISEMKASARGMDLADKIRDSINSATTRSKNIFQKLWDGLVALWNWINEKIIQPFLGLLKIVWDFIYDKIIMPFLDLLKALWDFIYEKIILPFLDMLKAVWDFIYEKIILPFLDMLKAAWDFIYEQILLPVIELFKFVFEAIGALLTGIWKAFQSVFDVIIEAFVAIWKAFEQIFAVIIDAFAAAWKAIEEIFAVVIDAFKAAWNFIYEKILMPVIELFQFVFKAIGALLTGVWEMYKAGFDLIIDAFTALWEAAEEIFAVIIDAFKAAWSFIYEKILMPVIELFQFVFEAIGALLTGVWELYKAGFDLIIDAFTAIWGAIEEIFAVIVNALSAAWEAVKKIFDNIIEGVKSAFSFIKEKIFDPIVNALGSVFNTIKEKIFDPVVKALGGVFSTIKEKIFDPIVNALGAVFNTVKEKIFDPIVNGIKGAFDSLKNIGDTFKNMGTQIWEGLKAGLDGIGKIFTDIFSALNPSGLFEKIFKLPSNAWGKGTIEKTLGIDIPFVKFAEGGMVPGNPVVGGDSPLNDKILAMLSPGEAVVPRSIMNDPILSKVIQAILNGDYKVPGFFGGTLGKIAKGDFKGAVQDVQKTSITQVTQDVSDFIEVAGEFLNPAMMWDKVRDFVFNDLIMSMFSANKFHTGGLVPGFANGGEVPAVLQPGEFVVRAEAAKTNYEYLNRLNAGGGTMAPVEQNWNLNVTINAKTDLSPEQIRREVVPAIEKELKRKSLDGRAIISKAGLR